MKTFAAISAALFFMQTSALFSQGIQVNKARSKAKAGYGYSFELCDSCNAPESAYFDAKSDLLFISNMIGEGQKKDGQGTIQKVHPSGKMLHSGWVKGLNAPKGMRADQGKLYVSDIDEVVVIDIKSGVIEKKIKIPGAQFLNDVAIDNKGTIYVSDTLASKIYQINGDKVAVFAAGDQLESPNGLLVVGNSLMVASWGLTKDWSTKKPGRLMDIDLKSKAIRYVTKEPLGNLDGLELDHLGNFLVSDWVAGKVYRVTRDGKITTLLYGFKGSADIGFIPKSKLLIVPRMQENVITAFDLGKYPNYLN